MMTLDASPAPAYVIYQSDDYQGGMSSHHRGRARLRAIDQADLYSAAQPQPAVLIHVVNSMDQVNQSTDPVAVDGGQEMTPRTQISRTRSFRTSVATWQWISELIAVGAFLVTAYVMVLPGIGKDDN